MKVLKKGFTNHIFFVCMLLFSAATVYFTPVLAFTELAVLILVFLIYRHARSKQRGELAKEIDTLNLPETAAASISILNQPLPACVVRLEDGELLWGSPAFMRLTGRPEPIFERSITDMVDLPLKWLKEGKTACPHNVSLNCRDFSVCGTLARGGDGGVLALLSWIDVTELTHARNELAMREPVVGVIALDNYEEIVKGLPDSQKANLLAAIDDRIAGLTNISKGIVSRYERDRHLCIFESQGLKKLSDGKFALLDSVRELTGAGGIPATLSIGLGCEGSSMQESLAFANLAIDMALSRGGDQVVIKNKHRFEFYGGKAKEFEKRTKVKARVMAHALRELMAGASMIIVMGHTQGDIDSVGAAGGIVALARKLGRRVHIVSDTRNTTALSLIDRLMAHKEYNGVFIDAQNALLLADRDTLLVVVDTSRPEMVESPVLLQALHRVAVIDHHRRAATYIDNATMTFHEPYASSSCELVCELIQYTLDTGDLLRVEADGLLAGIAMDTKDFTMHTGARTFEAAAYLKDAGADTISVKKLFQTDLASNLARYQIVSKAEMIGSQIAIAAAESSVDRVIAAQAADDLLTVSGVQASFVLTTMSGQVVVSGRSLGGINVQVIAEKIGGGGHQTSAGAQLPNTTVAEAKARLTDAINEYLSECG
ncbi:MAG: DHH family phosphoesterase [Oscillospiraceae bacterium]|nr:DHH family phosphoesterase [Oscillospiraceae bacterium]